MDTRQSYDLWASQYDTNDNKTRDLEAKALRLCLQNIHADKCLEIGCGTGKNSVWLKEHCTTLTAIDLSEGMLQKARQKTSHLSGITFITADINQPWTFATGTYDLIIFSLVLEHIADLDHIFHETSRYLNAGGYLYIGELHPFKQYMGSKARFEINDEVHGPDCYVHNVSEYLTLAKSRGFLLEKIDELFDDEASKLPRILTLLFSKPQ